MARLPTARRASRSSTASGPSTERAGRRSCRSSPLPGWWRVSTRSSSPTDGRSIRCHAPAISRTSCRSRTATHKTPNVALLAGSLVGFVVMLVIWFTQGGEAAGTYIGGTLLNMAVFGAMFSYLLQGLTFLQLRRRFPHIERPYKQPVRNARRVADRDHRVRHDRLPAHRPALPAGHHRRRRSGTSSRSSTSRPTGVTRSSIRRRKSSR